MGLNNPVPRSLKSETKKAAKVLVSFIKPNQVLGTDQIIPPHVLKKAKGLAIITVIKAGFLFSGRAGSGVIVARLPDGTWSAPSGIGMAGAGAGGLIGAELTDFVFILNNQQAVDSFSRAGTLTLGGNISVAAGPLGRNAEADAAASAGGVATVFTYSKTKGLFAGISVEGSAIVERKDANRKFYGASVSAKQILSGRVRPPPAADPLFRVLESRAFNFRVPDESYADSFYDDIPESFDSSDADTMGPGGRSNGRRGYGRYDDDFYSSDDDFGGSSGRYGRGPPPDRFDRRGDPPDRFDRYGGGSRGRRSSYDDPNGVNEYYRSQMRGRPRGGSSRWDDAPSEKDRFDKGSDRYDRYGDKYDRYDRDVDDLSNRFSRSRISSGGPASSGRAPRNEKAEFGAASPSAGDTFSNTPKAVALYTFSGEEYGDLPFRKGDVITILKKSDSQDDWWTGRVGGREGIFPANYVELV
ncbi:ZYRO0G00792p [Zygosaccharomyces rouxii]|uniref:ZYRO0G00792p n=1 Tax=Zygosaccharomyces rouxii (strain ATCC 2623 / CBS 732 / NBRC 1130 / NCYC 568 / NRRL Y-229) TaxID=559307 RepID=C5E1R7_ZYGRC|nr:uncharacterized protein ZYRO0G00792g [Zygosaccharomyces rouxii]KAH9202108.1 hypothetical protein LQ764DRAFT_616 [Zygosaccharomyces rouxii]CAR29110.1 ZYRO0G00792p [Zygosaccharomyces rouxii]